MLKINIPKDFFTTAFFDLLSKVIVGLSSIFLIRILSVGDYAVYVKFNAIASMIFGIFGNSLATTFARTGTEYYSRGYGSVFNLYKYCLGSVFVVSLFLGVASNGISLLYRESIGVVILAILYGLMQAINKLNQSYLQINKNFAQAGLLENLKNLIQFICFVTIWFIITKITWNSVAIIFLISLLVPIIIGSFTSIRNNSKDFDLANKCAENALLKIMFFEGGILVIYYFLLNLIDQTDILLVNWLLDDSSVANYGVALKYYTLLLTLQGSLTTVFRIRTSTKEMIDSPQERKLFAQKWLKKTWIFILFIAILGNVVAHPLMRLLNGIEYDAAIPVFRVFIIGSAISYLFAPNAAIMMSAKKHILLCIYTLIALFINILIDYLLIPTIGISAAALATILGNAFLNIASFVTIQISKK